MELSDPHHPSPFEFAGGALCLDFVNTWEDREQLETEKLHSYRDLLRFVRQADVVGDEDVEALERRAEADPEGAAEAFAQARALRDSCYRLFSARVAGEAFQEEDLARLNAAVAQAFGHLRVEADPAGEPCCWAWCGIGETLEGPLWPLARSAAELLASDKLPRLRECGGDDCTWLFLDESRNRSRRWCSMETCGNRAKARRHYRKACRERDGA